MRNVVKGFQFAKMAVPKIHADRLNAAFSSFHGPRLPPAPRVSGAGSLHTFRNAPKSPLVTAKPIGKNLPGRRGFKL